MSLAQSIYRQRDTNPGIRTLTWFTRLFLHRLPRPNPLTHLP